MRSLAASVVLGIAGCGGGDPGGLASFAPPDAPLYAEFVLRPEGDQAGAVESFAERVGGIDDPGAELVAGLDAVFADNDLDYTYANDVEPWLGERAAVFVRSFEPSSVGGGVPDFALIVETSDPDAARGFVDRLVETDPAPQQARSYGGVE